MKKTFSAAGMPGGGEGVPGFILFPARFPFASGERELFYNVYT